jgi:hypothetical protein
VARQLPANDAAGWLGQETGQSSGTCAGWLGQETGQSSGSCAGWLGQETGQSSGACAGWLGRETGQSSEVFWVVSWSVGTIDRHDFGKGEISNDAKYISI